jgi:cobalt-zinc-cadmium resistance protein CzcA
VASELGRPDDGTDSTGFLQCRILCRPETLFGLDRQLSHKAALIAAINQKLQSFPGIIFNYTQPAEDAVDEAETGLKSALAVKVFGNDLDTLQQKGKEIKQILQGCAASPT